MNLTEKMEELVFKLYPIQNDFRSASREGFRNGFQSAVDLRTRQILELLRNFNLTQIDTSPIYPGFGRPHALAIADWLENKLKETDGAE